MANDIGNFFCANPNRDEAIVSIANHIKSFWTPRMRQKIVAAEQEGDIGLEELPKAAVRLLEVLPGFKPHQFPGGDAG
jgi:formate dehydrogenase subunit delta